MVAASIPFRKEMTFEYGVAAQITPLVRRVIARNPGPFTFHGTNSYIVGQGTVAVIDPGPDMGEHIDSLIAAVDGERVSHILVTHTHTDHSPAAAAFARAVGAPVIGARPKPAADGERAVEAGQTDFAPDVTLGDGDSFSGDGWTLTAVHTPGHMSNHHCLALAEENALFSGDHVMGWNTSIVSPPDGNMRDYMDSLRRCMARADATYHPGHGPPIDDPVPFVRAYLDHRTMREGEIETCLADGPATIGDMVRRMYQHLAEDMHGAAARSVHAHVLHMVETGRIACDGAATREAVYRRP